jgi:hypothetical protein
VGDEVNGRTSECVVDGKESSKVVEGCGLDDVLSSMSRLFAPPPDTSSMLWQLSDCSAEVNGS